MPVLVFLAAAACFTFVAIDRWWPCAVVGPAPDACGLRQDDSFDAALVLGGPWTAHVLIHVAGYVLLGLAIVLAARAATTDRRARLAGWVAAALPWLTGWTVLFRGNGSSVTAFLFVILTLAVGFLAYASVRPAGGPRPWTITYGVAIWSTSLLVDFFLFTPILNLGYVSWDTTPWTWLPTALACLVAAVALHRLGIGRRPAADPARGTTNAKENAWTASSGR